jgi:uncharacterized protein
MKVTKHIDWITKTEDFIKDRFFGEGTGHDWFHIDRVRKNAVFIAQKEGANLLQVEMAALLHDIADHKFHNGDLNEGPKQANAWLQKLELGPKEIKAIVTIIDEVSFKGAQVDTPVSSAESACVQDADRLDAIGAIGVARAFAFGGAHDRLLYDPAIEPTMHGDFESYRLDKSGTIAHFYEKLLLLKDRMQTETGKKLAAQRHTFMETYLEQFFREWNMREV